ncbi:protein kinase [Patescibacteria group bacterium]
MIDLLFDDQNETFTEKHIKEALEDNIYKNHKKILMILGDAVHQRLIEAGIERKDIEELMMIVHRKLQLVVSKILQEQGQKVCSVGLTKIDESKTIWTCQREQPLRGVKFPRKDMQDYINTYYELPRHPNIVPEWFHTRYISNGVTVYGGSLRSFNTSEYHPDPLTLEHCYDLPLEQQLKYAVDLMEGCLAMHEAGIVHRDIKPENTIISNNKCRITDSELMIDDGNFEKNALGTPTYSDSGNYGYKVLNGIPPRLLKGMDVYSFGIILLKIYTGITDFDEFFDKFVGYMGGRTDWGRLRSIQKRCPEINLKERIPRPMRKLIAKMLYHDRAKRPSLEKCIQIISKQI